MICNYCGASLPADAQFCRSCGKRLMQECLSQNHTPIEKAPVYFVEPASYAAPVPVKPKRNTKRILIAVIGALLAVALLALGACILLKEEKPGSSANDEVGNSEGIAAKSSEISAAEGNADITQNEESVYSENSAALTSESTLPEGDADITHTYELVIGKYAWDDAQAEAHARGGYLVTFDSMEELNRVTADIEAAGYKNVYFFIGGRRVANGGEYRWVNAAGEYYGDPLNDETAWSDAVWLEGEPSFEWKSKLEAYMELYYNEEEARWVWNDVESTITYPQQSELCGYIIEYEN